MNEREDQIEQPHDDSLSTRLTYLLIGGGIGAILALLLSPKPGAELRGDIADSMRKHIDRASHKGVRRPSRLETYRAREMASSATGGDETKGDYD